MDHYIEAAEGLDGLRHGGVDAGGVRDVGRHGDGRTASLRDVADSPRASLFRDVADGDFSALRGEHSGGRAADVAASAGYEGGFVLKSLHG